MTLGSDQPLLRVVSQSNLKGTTEGVYYQAPDVLLDAVTVRQQVHAEPFYWRLPGQFQGNQVRQAPSLEPHPPFLGAEVPVEVTRAWVGLFLTGVGISLLFFEGLAVQGALKSLLQHQT